MYLWKVRWKDNLFDGNKEHEILKLVKANTMSEAYIDVGVSTDEIISIEKVGRMVE